MAWTEPRVEKLRSLYAEGYSANIIADKMGVSRNAVIGKWHRLRLPERTTLHSTAKAAVATNKIIALCKANSNLTRTEIAAVIGCSREWVCQVVKQNGLPFRRGRAINGTSERSLGKLAKSLGLTADDLRRMAPK